jgi:hypothetical protein
VIQKAYTFAAAYGERANQKLCLALAAAISARDVDVRNDDRRRISDWL